MSYAVVEDYHRRGHFDYYRGYENPFYSMTFELDVTRLKAFADDHGYRTYLNLCYFFTRAAQQIEDFRYRWKDDKIVLYESIHPGLTVPAAGGSFTYAHFSFDPDVHRFNREADRVWPSSDQPGTLAAADRDDFIFFTSIPGAVFTGFTHAWNSRTDGAPRVAFGRLRERDGRRMVPVGVQVNHCFIDGRALGELAAGAQSAYDQPEASTG